jgi:hypothetical protein
MYETCKGTFIVFQTSGSVDLINYITIGPTNLFVMVPATTRVQGLAPSEASMWVLLVEGLTLTHANLTPSICLSKNYLLSSDHDS